MNDKEFRKYLSNLDDKNLLISRVHVENEMASRNIAIDVGDMGEEFAIEFFNSTSGLSNLIKAPTGVKNVDAFSRDGERYSIKTLMKAKKTGTVYPDSHDPDKQLFEYLLVVCLDSKYQLDSIFLFSWKDFVKARAWDKRMNAWYIPGSKKRLQIAKKIFPKEIKV